MADPTPKPSIPATAAALVLGLSFIGAAFFIRPVSFEEEQQAEGVVLEADSFRTASRAVIEYRVNGERFVLEEQKRSSPVVRKGDRVTVRYSGTDPFEAARDTGAVGYLWLAFFALGVGLSVLGVRLLLRRILAVPPAAGP